MIARSLRNFYRLRIQRLYWIVKPDTNEVLHVYPNRDTMRHEARNCWCGPDQPLDPRTPLTRRTRGTRTMTSNSELVYTTSTPALIASEVARRTITETVAANAARLTARDLIDNDQE